MGYIEIHPLELLRNFHEYLSCFQIIIWIFSHYAVVWWGSEFSVVIVFQCKVSYLVFFWSASSPRM